MANPTGSQIVGLTPDTITAIAAAIASNSSSGAVTTVDNGTDATGQTAPAGATGLRGWASSSYGTLTSILSALTGILRVNVQNSSMAVTGSFYQATQPVSATALPLPTGAAQDTTVAGITTKLGTTLNVAPQASETHLGEIGGNVGKFNGTFGPASSTTFSAGTAMVTTPIELTGMGRIAGGSGVIASLTVGLAVANTAQIDVFLFTSQPTGTYAVNTTFNMTASDRAACIGVIPLTQWTAGGSGGSVGQAPAAPQFYSCDDGSKKTSLWAMPVARGSIGPLTAAADASIMARSGRN